MLLTYTLVSCAVIIFLLYKYVSRHFSYWEKKNIITSKSKYPLFGNVLESALRRKCIGAVFKELYDEFPNEKVVGVYRMTTPGILIRDLDIIKHVMIKDFDLFVDRGLDFDSEGLGKNLFHSDGDTWRVLRNKLTPIFTSGKLKNMMYLLIQNGDRFIDHVKEIIQKQPEQEMHKLIQKYTQSSISACAFGIDMDVYNGDTSELDYVDEKIFTTNFANELDMLFPGILKKLNASLFPRKLGDIFLNLVKTVSNERNGQPGKRKDFMDLLLQLKQEGELQGSKKREEDSVSTIELNDKLMAAQAFVFYAAGYETSATTMTFMLFQLARNPDIQDKLIEEIDEVLANHNGQVTYDSINDMPYLEKVFNETLRMYPLVEPLQRRAKQNYSIPGMDLVIEKGMLVLVSPLGIQNDPKYYPNPDKFDPERFSKENSAERHPCAYMPFGVGPRNCIGMRFAKVQSRICIVKLLSNFKVEATEKTKQVMEFQPDRPIIGPRQGVVMKIVPR